MTNTFKFSIDDQRQRDLMSMDPDLAEGYNVWIKAFLSDLENRYRGSHVRAEINLTVVLKDLNG